MGSRAVVVHATFVPQPGHEENVRRILTELLGPTRAEDGCDTFDLYRNATEFALFERYRDVAAVEAHRGTAHYAAYRAAIVEHLSGPIGVTILEVEDEASRG